MMHMTMHSTILKGRRQLLFSSSRSIFLRPGSCRFFCSLLRTRDPTTDPRVAIACLMVIGPYVRRVFIFCFLLSSFFFLVLFPIFSISFYLLYLRSYHMKLPVAASASGPVSVYFSNVLWNMSAMPLRSTHNVNHIYISPATTNMLHR